MVAAAASIPNLCIFSSFAARNFCEERHWPFSLLARLDSLPVETGKYQYDFHSGILPKLFPTIGSGLVNRLRSRYLLMTV
jgi:hypothetical protein